MQGESACNAPLSGRFRVGGSSTFRDLRKNAARIWGETADSTLLEDDCSAHWPLDAEVLLEVSRSRGEQTIRLVRSGDMLDEGNEDDTPTAYLLQMLSAPAAAPGTHADDADPFEDAEGKELTPSELAAIAAEDSDSDDDGQQREEYVEPPLDRRKLMLEGLIHLLFVTLLVFSVREKRSIRQAFTLFEAMQTVFVDENFGDYFEKAFEDIANFEEVWDWTNDVLMPGLFESDVDDEGNVMMYNRLVGGVRLRQLRVRNDSCTLPSSAYRSIFLGDEEIQQSIVFENSTGQGACFSNYFFGGHDTAPFGPCTAEGRAVLKDIDNVDKYNSSCEGSGFSFTPYTDAPTMIGKLSAYDSSGYVRDIVPLEERAYLLQQDTMAKALNELRSFLWLDVQTRAYIISFSIYNGNYNSFAALNFLFEFSPGGTVLPTYSIKVLKQEVWENAQSSISDAARSHRVWLDVIVYGFVAKFLFDEVSEYISMRCKYGTSKHYFQNVWNVLEIINIIPFFISLSIRLNFIFSPEGKRYSVFAGNRYQEMGNIASMYSLSFMLDSVSILVSFFKIFKYLRIFASANLLIYTIASAARSMAYFVFVLILFLIAAVIIATQMFGTSLLTFSSYTVTVVTLAQMLLGVVDIYWEMIRTSPQPLLALVFFFIYIFLMFFVLVNIFLAILNDAYAKAQEDQTDAEEVAALEKERLEEEAAKGEVVKDDSDDKPTLRERTRLHASRMKQRMQQMLSKKA